MARPTKLTAELQAELCKALAAGNYLETACAYVGISRITVRNWMREGARSKRGQKREFLNAIKKAAAEAEIKDVKRIGDAAETQWQAAAWRLERKYWKRWGRKDKITNEVSGPNGKAIEIQAVDYRVAIAPLAPGPVGDSDASSEG